eukprot:2623101-Prymnesium_polylepis.2
MMVHLVVTEECCQQCNKRGLPTPLRSVERQGTTSTHTRPLGHVTNPIDENGHGLWVVVTECVDELQDHLQPLCVVQVRSAVVEWEGRPQVECAFLANERWWDHVDGVVCSGVCIGEPAADEADGSPCFIENTEVCILQQQLPCREEYDGFSTSNKAISIRHRHLYEFKCVHSVGIGNEISVCHAGTSLVSLTEIKFAI